MLQNAYFLAKIGADTAENEQHFAEILPTDALCPPALRSAAPSTPRGSDRWGAEAGGRRREGRAR